MGLYLNRHTFRTLKLVTPFSPNLEKLHGHTTAPPLGIRWTGALCPMTTTSTLLVFACIRYLVAHMLLCFCLFYCTSASGQDIAPPASAVRNRQALLLSLHGISFCFIMWTCWWHLINFPLDLWTPCYKSNIISSFLSSMGSH